MGFHNDRRAGGKMPATGSWRDNFYNYILIHSEISLISTHIRRDMERVYIVLDSHFLAAFRPVPQSCTSSTLLRHRTKIRSSHATLSSTFIIKQALKSQI